MLWIRRASPKMQGNGPLGDQGRPGGRTNVMNLLAEIDQSQDTES
jgi:hypothetical protein